MRTFHIGGAAQRGAEQSSIEARPVSDGQGRRSSNRNVVKNTDKKSRSSWAATCRAGADRRAGRERARHRVPPTAPSCWSRTRRRSSAATSWPSGIRTPADHHREGRYGQLRRPGRRRLHARGARRGHRHRPAKVVIDWKQQPKGNDLKPRITLRDEARARWSPAQRPGGPLLHVGGRHPVGRERPGGRRPATCWPVSRAKAPRPATSPVVCRGWRSCSRPASRRTHAIIAEIDGRVEFGGLQEQAPDRRRAGWRKVRSRSST